MHAFLTGFFWVVIVAAILVCVFWVGKVGFFDKAKASVNGTKLTFSQDNWRKYFPWLGGIGLVLLVVVLVAGCSSSSAPEVTAVPAVSCQGSYHADIVAPSHEDRIAARNRALIIAGYTVTGDDNIDNHVLGGGDPDGGIYLSGSLDWTTGPLVGTQCPIIGGTALIFGTPFGLSGGMNSSSEFGFGYDGGPITGYVVGNTVTGRLMEGGGREFVYGVFANGTFTPMGKF
jgi:hypothetical protein